MIDLRRGRCATTRSIDVLQVVTDTDRRGAQISAVALEAALVERGLEVSTVALIAGTSPGLAVETLGNRSLAASTLRALRSRCSDAEVVIAHGSRTLPASAVATLGTGVPFVYRNIGDPYYWGTTRRRRLRTRLFLARAARVVALTDETGRRLTDAYGVSPNRLVTIPQAISPDEFPKRTPAAQTAAKASLGFGQSDRLALCLGALSQEKDVPTAIEALSELPPRWRLLVAGDGPERQRVEREAQSVAGGRVNVLGEVADTAALLAAADVLLLPSRTEGLPGVVIEAAMTGVPAVVTDVGFVRDIVEDGVTGYVVAPGEPTSMAEAVLAAEEAGLERLGDAAHQRAIERFSLNAAADRWAEVVTALGPGVRVAR